MNKENMSAFEMEIKSFREINILGYSPFGILKLMRNYLQQFAVKYFGERSPSRTRQVRESFLVRGGILSFKSPCALRADRVSHGVKDWEGAFVME
jgi:hypothetical protein